MKKSNLPFSHLDADAWRRLGYLAVAVLFLLNGIISLVKLGLFNGVGGDYLAFWTAGKIANIYGFSRIYDVDTIKLIQFQQVSQLNIPFGNFEIFPAPYLSFFLLPFRFLANFEIKVSYWIWSALNTILLIGYLYYFNHRLSRTAKSPGKTTAFLFPLLISYPVYTNFLAGQLEVLLMVFAGEFLLCMLNHKEWLAGFWIGSLLIKPQVIILVLPALLFAKRYRVLIGFCISSILILLSSILLSGWNGFLSWITFLVSYSRAGTYFNSPNGMANWRMAASNINSWTASSWGWLLGGTGMLVTLAIWFSLVRKHYPTGSTGWLLNFGAIFAASLAFTWHSHVHMGMVLIPFLIILLFHHPSLGKQALDGWVFSFPAAMILSYLVVILLDRGLNLPINVNAVSGPLLGLTGLVFYMLFSYKILRLPETGTIS